MDSRVPKYILAGALRLVVCVNLDNEPGLNIFNLTGRAQQQQAYLGSSGCSSWDAQLSAEHKSMLLTACLACCRTCQDHGYNYAHDKYVAHLVGEFSHERRFGETPLNYACADNHTPMHAPHTDGQARHWILEIHILQNPAIGKYVQHSSPRAEHLHAAAKIICRYVKISGLVASLLALQTCWHIEQAGALSHVI